MVLLISLSLVALLMFASTALAHSVVADSGCTSLSASPGGQYCSATPRTFPPLTAAPTPGGAAQYQYGTASPSPSAFAGATVSAAASELPSTGGASLLAFGAGALLVAGGLLARRIVR